MFHKSFRNSNSKNKDIAEEEDEDEDDCESLDLEKDDTPASPGMEHLLKDMNERKRKISKNVKFNKSFDVAKLCADNLKDGSNKVFETYLQCFKTLQKCCKRVCP